MFQYVLQLPHAKPTTGEGALGKPMACPQSHLYVALILLPPITNNYTEVFQLVLSSRTSRNSFRHLQCGTIEGPVVTNHSAVATRRMFERLFLHFNLHFLFGLVPEELLTYPAAKVWHSLRYFKRLIAQ